MKKYSFDDHPEHKAQLGDWAKKWTANAMSTQSMTDEDRALCVDAVNRMYAAVGLKSPRVVFVKSPFVAAFASGFSAAIWYDRKNKRPIRSTRIATRDVTSEVTDAITRTRTIDASRDIVDITTYSEIMDATYGATEDATIAATFSAAGAATFEVTFDAARDATQAEIRKATEIKISSATENAIEAATYDAIDEEIDETTLDEAYDVTRSAIYEAVNDVTEAATEAATDDATEIATRHATRLATNEATDRIIDDATIFTIYDATDYAVDAATQSATEYITDDATEAATKAATEDVIRTATNEKFKNWYVFQTGEMKNVVKYFNGDQKFFMNCSSYSWRMRQGGNQWSGWDSFLSFFRHIAKLPIDYSAWDAWETLSLHSGPRYVHEEFCIISDRPELLLVDDQNRPHCNDGPFCRWRDGSALYSVHGVRVPAWIIEFPEEITIEKIDAEENAEVRRVMIQKFGWKNYIDQKGGKLIDKDKNPIFGELWEFLDKDGDKIQIVYVRNGTQEPDGSYRYYSLRVRPRFTKAMDAVMSTYPGLSQEEFMAMSQFRS